MDNFDLKKYLIENKVTMNSKMLKEQDETEQFIEVSVDDNNGKIVHIDIVPSEGMSLEEYVDSVAQNTAENFIDQGKEDYVEDHNIGNPVFFDSSTLGEKVGYFAATRKIVLFIVRYSEATLDTLESLKASGESFVRYSGL